MVRETFKATFYKATVDANTAPYTEAVAASVNAYTGAASTSCYITAPQKTKTWEAETLEDVSGWLSNSGTLRDQFEVVVYPYAFNDSASYPDLTDWEGLASFLCSADYLWVRFDAGTRKYPTDVLKVHPVILEAISESVNAQSGTHEVTLSLRVKGAL